MLQIKYWVYYPNPKTNQKIALDKFFDEINKFLEVHDVSSESIIISDSSEYIFVHMTYKVVKPRNKK